MNRLEWDAVSEALSVLVDVCEAEQRAVVTLDADEVARLTPRKRALIAEFGDRFGLALRATRDWPAEVRGLAVRCREVNRLNHKLLTITVRRMEGLLCELGARPEAAYGSTSTVSRPGRIDSRV